MLTHNQSELELSVELSNWPCFGRVIQASCASFQSQSRGVCAFVCVHVTTVWSELSGDLGLSRFSFAFLVSPSIYESLGTNRGHVRKEQLSAILAAQ